MMVICPSLFAQQQVGVVESMKLARLKNPDLQAFTYTIKAAEADRVSAGLRPNPIFNVQLLQQSTSQYRAPGSSTLESVNGQYWYQLTKPFQVAGQRRLKTSYANEQVIQSELDVNEFARGLYFITANKWLDAWAARIQVEILNRAKMNIDSLVLINEVRLRDKVITNTDLNRTKLLQQQYERDILTARKVYLNELQYLQYLVGTKDSLRLSEGESLFNNFAVTRDSVLHIGIDERADVKSAKQAIHVSEVNMQLQDALAVPPPEAGLIVNPQNNIPYIGLYGTIRLPFFDRNQGQRQRAAVQKQQAEQMLWATEQQANAEILNAYRNYATSLTNVRNYEMNRASADTILESVRYAYIHGGTNIIDLLEAQRSWLGTQQGYYNSQVDLRRSIILLLYTTGLIVNFSEP